jgi:hypothetical protein
MSTSFQGASGSNGPTGLLSGLRQPVSGNRAAPQPVLTRLEQILQEQSISNQIRKLTVRVLVNVLGLGANKLPGDTSTLLKRS